MQKLFFEENWKGDWVELINKIIPRMASNYGGFEKDLLPYSTKPCLHL